MNVTLQVVGHRVIRVVRCWRCGNAVTLKAGQSLRWVYCQHCLRWITKSVEARP